MAPAGDLSLVDTVARGELQFFVPGVDLELFGSSRSGRGAGTGRLFPSATRVFISRRERPDRSSMAEVAPGRGAHGRVWGLRAAKVDK